MSASDRPHSTLPLRARPKIYVENIDATVANMRFVKPLDEALVVDLAAGSGSGKAFEIEVRMGAGAYICGEETALLESLEGKRAEVRYRPPLPAIKGLFGLPTIINNVISLATVPVILARGADPDARRARSGDQAPLAHGGPGCCGTVPPSAGPRSDARARLGRLAGPTGLADRRASAAGRPCPISPPLAPTPQASPDRRTVPPPPAGRLMSCSRPMPRRGLTSMPTSMPA